MQKTSEPLLLWSWNILSEWDLVAITAVINILGPPLLTWINFNPSMDK